uniref:Uncharacterized protein n=1 Tax=Anguilla anguilla TaxID=7936 RepID=A0A0E9SQL9_ANGAN
MLKLECVLLFRPQRNPHTSDEAEEKVPAVQRAKEKWV